MTTWIFVLIPLVAIIGAFILEYQKTKMKMMTRSRQNEQDVDDLRKLIDSMKGRIENLEAIAVGDPDSFSTGSDSGMNEIEISDEFVDYKEENQKSVSDMANKRREKS